MLRKKGLCAYAIIVLASVIQLVGSDFIQCSVTWHLLLPRNKLPLPVKTQRMILLAHLVCSFFVGPRTHASELRAEQTQIHVLHSSELAFNFGF